MAWIPRIAAGRAERWRVSPRLWRSLKWASLGISIGSMLLAVGLMVFGGHGAPLLVITSPNSGTKVDKPLIVERKGKRILWRLRADKAEQKLKTGLRLTRPTLELFTDAGEKVTISGAWASFDPLHRNIVFHQKVVALYQQWRLTCDTLAYDSGKDEVTVPGPFVATGDKTTIRGRGLRADRQSQRLWVDHGVHIVDRGSHWLGVQP